MKFSISYSQPVDNFVYNLPIFFIKSYKFLVCIVYNFYPQLFVSYQNICTKKFFMRTYVKKMEAQSYAQSSISLE